MNDPNFNEGSNKKQTGDNNVTTIEPNCIVQPLLEIVTAREIKIDEELLLSCNYSSK